jgi:AraC-like DNA-binding protein
MAAMADQRGIPEGAQARSRDSLAASAAGDVRIGPLISVPEVLRELGVEPRRVFTEAGLTLAQFGDPDNRLSFQALSRLMLEAAEQSGYEHFGLLVGQRFRLEGFGAIGELMRNMPTAGEALRALLLHLHLHDRGAAPILLRPEPSRVLLGYSIYRLGIPSVKPIYDLVMAIAYRIMQALCGPTWKPVRVQFAHARPRDVAPYRELFGASVRFDAGVSGVVFASSWLDQPLPGADPDLRLQLSRAIHSARADSALSFGEEVQAVLHSLVRAGSATSAEVADLFGIHERTLRKRLAAEGASLQELIAQTRFELAKQLLQSTGLPVAEIAAVLHYSDANVFSRAFRNWAGTSPRDWRAQGALA